MQDESISSQSLSKTKSAAALPSALQPALASGPTLRTDPLPHCSLCGDCRGDNSGGQNQTSLLPNQLYLSQTRQGKQAPCTSRHDLQPILHVRYKKHTAKAESCLSVNCSFIYISSSCYVVSSPSQGASSCSSCHFFLGMTLCTRQRRSQMSSSGSPAKVLDLSISPSVFEKTEDTDLCFPANCRKL